MQKNTSPAGFFSRLLFGAPLRSKELSSEKLPKWKALPIFSSDALSSIGYGPEQIALVLVLPGLILYPYFIWVVAAIICLLMIVTLSYSQVIHVHPDGGGSYSISKQYLGEIPALLAAASLFADYVLTVAVSVSSGTDALVSAWPVLLPYQIWIDLGVLFGVLMMINLRGIREASTAFVWPTYAFLFTIISLIVSGLYQAFFLHQVPMVHPAATAAFPTSSVLFLLLLRAFANGCASMTGVEAIANGSDSFRSPRAHNASITIAIMAVLLSSILAGISYLIVHFGILPVADQTLLSLLTEFIWGRGVGFFIFQLLTMIILYLAANTAYNGLPPLMSLLAQDGYMPRYLANRGARLSFNNGIIFLTLAAAAMIILFHGNVEHLISLYALGVFLSFTLAQLGLCVHWLQPEAKSVPRLLLNGFGALVTGAVALVIVVTKFVHGVWIIMVFLPLMMYLLKRIKRHYDFVGHKLGITREEYARQTQAPTGKHFVLLPVASPTQAVARAVRYAKRIVPVENIRALHIAIDEERGQKVMTRWREWNDDIKMVVIPSPYRLMTEPLIDYVRRFKEKHPGDSVTVLIPEFEVSSPYARLLHNQQGLVLRWQLLNKLDVIVTTVPMQLGEEVEVEKKEPPTEAAAQAAEEKEKEARETTGDSIQQ